MQEDTIPAAPPIARDMRAMLLLASIRSVVRRVLSTCFTRWRTTTDFLGLVAGVQPETLKMQLLEFKYRYKMSSTRLKSVERDMFEMQKDFTQREIAITQEKGNLVSELEIATSRALGAEAVISKLEHEVMLIYGIQQKDQEMPGEVMNKSRLSWASVGEGVSKMFRAVGTPTAPAEASEETGDSNNIIEIRDGPVALDQDHSAKSSAHHAVVYAVVLKIAALALNMSFRHKTSGRCLLRGFLIWSTHTTAQRVIAAAQTRYNDFKRQNEKYQLQVKDHWSKTEMYMKKLREKYDDSKKKRDELQQEITNHGKEKASLVLDIESYRTRIAYLETELAAAHTAPLVAADTNGDNSNLADLEQMQIQLVQLRESLELETSNNKSARRSAEEALGVLSEFRRWDAQQQAQLERLATMLNVDYTALSVMNSPGVGDKFRQISFTPAMTKNETPQASRIMNTLRKSAASSKQVLKATSRTPSQRRSSVHAAMKDAEPQFSSTAMKKIDSINVENEDADFDLRIPVFGDLPVPPREAELLEIKPMIVNPDVEAAMNSKVPTGGYKGGHNVVSDWPLQSAKPSSFPRTSAQHYNNEDAMTQFEDSLENIWHIISSQRVESKAIASNVRVAIRMRPLNEKENGMSASRVVKMSGGQNVTVLQQDSVGVPESNFSYDFCFDAAEDEGSASAGSQRVVFDKLGMEVLAHAWHGYNACLFAYGQTGSGKSYSMMGTANDAGIIPRVCRALFYMIIKQTEAHSRLGDGDGLERRGFSVEASYLEIYNENIRDLLDPSRVNLKVREHPTTGVFVENLSSCAVECYKDVEDLLEMGLEQRTTAATNMNSESSRSHSVFTLSIRSFPLTGKDVATDKKKNVRLSQLRLVDLAGSERASSTGATGARLKEGANINKSLSTLGRCISALAKIAANGSFKVAMAASSTSKLCMPPKPPAPVVPFRESILTWLLRESLCGNAKTSMLATISPAHVYLGETLSTLRYAYSAKQISTQAVVNEDPTAKIINDLRGEVMRLREQLELSLSSNTEANKDLKSNNKLRMSLSNAESALQAYEKTNNSENQRLSMRNVKRNLLNRHISSFGTEDMNDDALLNVPYFVFLSNDPQMNLAVKVYVPVGKKLKIGRAVSGTDECEDNMLDLQIDGLGIEDLHCIFSHDCKTQLITAEIVAHAATYHNGVSLLPEGENEDAFNDSLILRSGSHIMEGENYGVTSDVIRRSCRGQGNDQDNLLHPKSSESLSKGRGIGSAEMSCSVVVAAGDRIVLGECSHVFVFVTPDYAAKVNAGEVSMPTYNQAIREVILGRVESAEEKKRRIVMRICNVYRKPLYKKYFEESFIDALKSVRETSKMAHRLCPDRGMFFKVTISSLIDMSSLFSLSINDLCDYTNLTIRVRCYEITDDESSLQVQEQSLAVHISPSGSNSARKHYGDPPFISLPSARDGDNEVVSSSRSTPRPMSLSHRSVNQTSQTKPLNHGPSTVTSQPTAFINPDHCRVVMEVSLHSFYEGLVVLRSLYSVLQPLSQCLFTSRIAINAANDDFFTQQERDLEICRIIMAMIQSIGITESDSCQTSNNSDYIDLGTCRGLFELYKPGVATIQTALNSVGINGDLFFTKCQQRCNAITVSKESKNLSLSRNFIKIIIDSVEDSLFRGILSCFESTENLVMKDTVVEEGKENSAASLPCQHDELGAVLRKLLETRLHREQALSGREKLVEEAINSWTIDNHRDSFDGSGYQATGNVESYVLPEGSELIELPSEYYNNAGVDGNQQYETDVSSYYNNYSEGVDDEELLISDADRAGATDWTVHIDQDTGYKFIFSLTLNESRWLNY